MCLLRTRGRLPVSWDQFIRQVGGWAPYEPGAVEVREDPDSGHREVWLSLDRTTRSFRCSGCGRRCSRYHDCEEREVRDLPILGASLHLVLWRFRVDCPECGPRLEALDWLDPYARVTKRLAASVARLCKVMPIKQVAEFHDLHWGTVKAIDKAHLEAELGPPDFAGVELLLIDEFALRKGHRYATVVADASTKRVLWVGKGRSREEVRVFFELLGKAGCARIKAVGMDMSHAFRAEVQRHCPKAEIVYDLFHVVAKYGKEVVDAIRVSEANRLREDKPARKLIKGAKWLLLRNKSNLPDEESRIQLKEVLEANQALMTAYVLKDDLKQLWTYQREGWARRAWEGWLARAQESGIKPLIHFAKRLTAYLPGILAHCRWPLHTSLLEGINNKIKVLKRTAYGYRDDAYFFLKIRSAFPGNP